MIKNYFLWLFKFITVIIVILFVIPVIIAGIGAAVGSDAKVGGNRVAVVELSGAIYESKDTLDQLYAQVNSKSIDGVVLRIDSPGGAVGPSQEIYETVKKLKKRKPIVVSMGSVAASGGLYSALGASKIFAQPGTLTGSIGVIMELPNVKGVAEKVGFSMNTIKSGALKDTGNMFRDMSEAEKEYLEKVAGQTHLDFIRAVMEGRSLNLDQVKSFADGRVIIGREAKELGLVDEMGDVYDAAREIYKLLGKPLADDADPKLYYPQDKFRDFQLMLEGAKSLIRGANLTPSMRYQWVP